MNRRFSTSNCPTTEMAWTNFELRREIDKEVRINIENEAKIKRLERQLARYEDEITFLNNLIEKSESRENDNKEELSKLRLELRKSNSICEKKEEYILFQESLLLKFQESLNKLEKRTMAQPIRQQPINPPNLREYIGVFDDLIDATRDIDDYIQGRPEAQSMTIPNVMSKFNTISDKAQRLSDIAEWSERELTRNSQRIQNLNNNINQLNGQINQITNQLQQLTQMNYQLQNNLATYTNNFNTLNQAYVLQGQQLQTAQVDVQLWQHKYQKWKNRAKRIMQGIDIIWLVNTPN